MTPPRVALGWTPSTKSKKSVARLVPAWMRIEPASARRKRPGRKAWSAATAVPTKTGTIEGGERMGISADGLGQREALDLMAGDFMAAGSGKAADLREAVDLDIGAMLGV